MSGRKRTPRQGPTGPVLVTGATGCVGTQVVEALLAAGQPVVASDRPGSRWPERRPGLVIREADLTRTSAIPALVRGVESIIHTAALVDENVPYGAQLAVNYHAVRSLYEAAAAVGTRTFVHLSSARFYAPREEALREEDPLEPRTPYERTKLLAEQFLLARSGAGPRAIVLRPALVYGPRGRTLVAPLATLPSLLRRFDGWLPRMKGGPRVNLVHAEDVARAALHVLSLDAPHGSVFNVAAPQALSAGEILNLVLEAGGLRQARLEVPFPTRWAGTFLPVLERQLPRWLLNQGTNRLWRRIAARGGLSLLLEARFDAAVVGTFGRDHVVDATRLAATGFVPRHTSFAEGWAETVRWYRAHRWIPAAPRAEEADGPPAGEGGPSGANAGLADAA